MDRDLLKERADHPRLGHPYFNGVDDMIASWAWHLADVTPNPQPATPPTDGTEKRYNTLGTSPEYGELVVPVLRLPAPLPEGATEMLATFIDLLIQDVVNRVWDHGGRAAVIAHLAPHHLPTEDVEKATFDDLYFLGMIAMQITYEMLDHGDQLRSLAARFAR